MPAARPTDPVPTPTGTLASLRAIVRFTSSLRRYYVVVVVTALLTAAAGIATPFLVGRATDVIINAVKAGSGNEVMPTVGWLVAGILGTQLLATVASNIGGYSGDLLSNSIRALMSTRYLDKLLRLPQSWFDSEMTGTIVSRLNRSITEISNFMKAMANTFFAMLLQTAAVLVISAIYYWPLAVLLAIVFPLYVWLTGLTSKKWQKLEGEKNTHVDIAGGRFAEVVGQIRVVRSFVREKHELATFTGHFDATHATTQAQSKHWHCMDLLRRAVLNLVFSLMYLLIFWRTLQSHFTVGDMVLLIQLITMARTPVEMMSWVLDTAQRAVAGSEDYFRVMNTPEVASPAALPAAPQRSADAAVLEFEHVHFGYGDGPDVLTDVTFDIKQGEKVALVSESGGGKTTLVNLLLGLYPLRSGHIRLDGVDIAAMPHDELRKKISIVFQDPSLFSDTVGENIRYGLPEASEADLAQATARANAAEFVDKLEGKFDAMIGERGLKLSGGQKQRIAVARAMLKDASVLVLDEATSALDTRSERAVQAGLEQLMAGRTSLVIAHRLSTIAGVDRIVTLKSGHVDEIGTPTELAQTGGVYGELLALQRRGEDSYLNAYQTAQ
ncbi:ABC transporter ATP-binding protein [Dermatophilus congolensis]|uniref:ABC transporter ATP-binding protein n=1 Tax=Dermatophilus congolensis TaxID=1863 RepID=UPI001AAE58CE|nr:ABC transporter ATP-binding protein [Dermatophilus congolensis]MBO3130240.1 ABC transporter ATP-binding protein [Dermatophilus congolensis]MBO3131131.1 ABC transporter ATP-binding protein [Dermatophilus congolensis]MBO3134711.1 ABC transporter ATP-binding protein [Dermatophilus congolensis]MBO3136946.1 ABC transporter ATP-binding protein [Dermatophilus congolensis]MBO3139192.1 ABC transporter ATP-binding protein [Dermatophilus congolensis]